MLTQANARGGRYRRSSLRVYAARQPAAVGLRAHWGITPMNIQIQFQNVQVLPSVEKQLVWFAGFEIKAYCFARQVSKQMLTDPFDWAVQICTHLIATLKLAQLFLWSCIKFFLLSFGIYTVSAAMWILSFSSFPKISPCPPSPCPAT